MRLVIRPTATGITPVNWLLDIQSVSNRVKRRSTEGGMEPVSRLLCNPSQFNLLRLCRLWGMVPLKRLSRNIRDWRLVRRPNVSGMTPSTWFLCIHSRLRAVSKPISSGMDPANDVESNRIAFTIPPPVHSTVAHAHSSPAPTSHVLSPNCVAEKRRQARAYRWRKRLLSNACDASSLSISHCSARSSAVGLPARGG